MAELRHLLQACVMAAAVTAAAMGATTADVESRSGSLEEGGASSLALMQRVEALEAAVARLAAVVADDDHEQLARQVAALEMDVSMVTLLDSRVRAVQAEQRLLSQDVDNVGRSVARWGREVEAVRQQVQRRDTSAESEKNPACCRALNESMLRAEERGRGVNASLSDLRRQLHNLSHDLQDLQRQTRQQPLLLCPAPYTKVGGQCFYLLEGRWAWDEARTSCQGQGAAVGGHGDLAVPADVAAFRVYVEALEAASSYVWVGGVREEGKWRWVTAGGSREEEVEEDKGAKKQSQEKESSPLGLPWDLGEPDDTPDQRHLCIHTVGSIKFHDCVNSARLLAMCQVT